MQTQRGSTADFGHFGGKEVRQSFFDMIKSACVEALISVRNFVARSSLGSFEAKIAGVSWNVFTRFTNWACRPRSEIGGFVAFGAGGFQVLPSVALRAGVVILGRRDGHRFRIAMSPGCLRSFACEMIAAASMIEEALNPTTNEDAFDDDGSNGDAVVSTGEDGVARIVTKMSAGPRRKRKAKAVTRKAVAKKSAGKAKAKKAASRKGR